ncbi:putative UBX5 UBX (ubiquitin regulatory X) domain-containing [Pyrenophora seminiperda CCB06]|uniref:Putative UBX5 UBX (Ubiquitin regulatory X) domain-containing n=1 Tax=Pyrenophora seminiperda CCB06 TaxID=1302712 RepID=A0A3M7ME55_9PLEO|nr:putative UBX5 UBX (ubiquitin regulatory X) domain-containing [Pyrenophora seminiperda CCB06]
MDDDAILNFCSIASCEPDKAAQYLRLTDGNFEQAIQLFFDAPGLDVAPSAPSQASAAAPSAQNPVHVDSDHDMDFDAAAHGTTPPARAQPGVEDDEAMARRLQEEMYGGGGPATAGSDDVRAPMQRTTETLVGPGSNWGPADDDDDVDAMVQEQLARRRTGMPHTSFIHFPPLTDPSDQGRAGIFNQQTTQTNVWDATTDSSTRRRELATATGGASEQSSKMSMLAELFRPPFEIMYQGSWEKARDIGKDEEKWLLVNIQDPAIFDCQRLNRDIWKNDDIKATVRENFLFMQYAKDDQRGQQYMNYYFHARDSSDAYPHIAIVDPRTGEQVKVWSGPPIPEPVEFHAQLHEFLDRYSLNVHAKNPVAKRKSESKKKDLGRMTEEEMLEMALRNSMDNGQGPKDDDPDALTKSTENVKGKAKAEEVAPEPEPEAEPSAPSNPVFAAISAHAPHTEPTATDPKVTTRIQFRGPSGRPIVRRFHLSDPVRRVYEWIKSDVPWEGKRGAEFDLAFMGKNLIEHLDETVEAAGLKGASVMVEFLDNE